MSKKGKKKETLWSALGKEAKSFGKDVGKGIIKESADIGGRLIGLPPSKKKRK